MFTVKIIMQNIFRIKIIGYYQWTLMFDALVTSGPNTARTKITTHSLTVPFLTPGLNKDKNIILQNSQTDTKKINSLK